jgi:hypothetical protein
LSDPWTGDLDRIAIHKTSVVNECLEGYSLALRAVLPVNILGDRSMVFITPKDEEIRGLNPEDVFVDGYLKNYFEKRDIGLIKEYVKGTYLNPGHTDYIKRIVFVKDDEFIEEIVNKHTEDPEKRKNLKTVLDEAVKRHEAQGHLPYLIHPIKKEFKLNLSDKLAVFIWDTLYYVNECENLIKYLLSQFPYYRLEDLSITPGPVGLPVLYTDVTGCEVVALLKEKLFWDDFSKKSDYVRPLEKDLYKKRSSGWIRKAINLVKKKSSPEEFLKVVDEYFTNTLSKNEIVYPYMTLPDLIQGLLFYLAKGDPMENIHEDIDSISRYANVWRLWEHKIHNGKVYDESDPRTRFPAFLYSVAYLDSKDSLNLLVYTPDKYMDVKKKKKIEALRAFMISSTAISMLNEADLRFLQRNFLAKLPNNSLWCINQAISDSYIYKKIFSRNLSRYKTFLYLVGEAALAGLYGDAWSVYNVFKRYFSIVNYLLSNVRVIIRNYVK